MQYRPLGRTKIQISAIAFGASQAGDSHWPGVDDESSIAAMRAAFDGGVTTFDTAEGYGDGHSERLLAKALGRKRDQVVFASKVSPNHLQPEALRESCERSLRNLDADHLDLYYIHWPAGQFGTEPVPIEDTMGALAELKRQGKIRAIGVSNFSRSQLEAAAACARIDVIQPPYSLFWRHIEKDILGYCLQNKISILAYSPMAQGLLTGRFRRGHVFAENEGRRNNRLFQGDNFERAVMALDRLQPIAEKYGLTLGQLALAWAIAQPQVSAIAGARTAAQAAENALVGDVEIDDDDLDAIDEIGNTVTDRQDSNPALWTGVA